MPRNSPELAEQVGLFRFRDLYAHLYPQLRWLHSSLNGVHLSDAQRDKAKASGMTAGIPDVFLPMPKESAGQRLSVYEGPEFYGLYIEMKVGKNRLTAEQEAFFIEARANGYRCEVCYSWVEAARVILDYLGIDDKRLRDYLSINTKATTPKPARRKINQEEG